MQTLGGPAQTDPSRRKIALTLAILFAGYLLLASSSTLWDRDEPRFARATVEMVESGDYLVPTFNGDLRPDKPAGIYWLMSVGHNTIGKLGFTELAYRLPSTLGITGAAFITFLVGRRLFNARVGYHAMIFFGSAIMVMYMATASTSDGTMNGLIALSLWCFVELAYGGKRLPLLILMAVALAGAQLVKGPVGVGVPLLSMATMGVLGTRTGAFKLQPTTWLGIAAAAVISFGAFAAWGIPANLASDGELLRQGIGKHVVGRATSPMENHGGSNFFLYLLWLLFYIPVIILAMTPWAMHLPAGFSALIRRNLGEPKQRAILWGWIAPTFILMTLVATKLPHYVLPIFPGLAVLCAAVIDPIHADRLSDKDLMWQRAGRFFAAPALVGAAAAAIAIGWFVPEGQALILPGTVLGLVILTFGTLQVYHLRKRRPMHATRTAMVGLPIALVIACLWLLPNIEAAIKPSASLAQAVREARLPVDAPIMLCGYNEPSVIFYLNQPIEHPVGFLSTAEEIAAWSREPGPGVLIIKRETLTQVQSETGELGLEVIFSSSAIQYSDGAADSSVLALERNADASD